MKTYEEYKETGVEWIGQIPKHWNIRKIKAVSTFQNGNGFPESEQGNLNGDYPFLKVSDINNPNEIYVDSANNYVNNDVVKEYKWTIVRENSILFAKIGEALFKNHRKINTQKVIIDNNMMAIGLNNNMIDLTYFFYVFKYFDMKDYANVSSVPSLNFYKLNNSKIPLPPIQEQEQIANYLDEKTTRINNIIERNEKLLELLKEEKTSLINKVVTKGLNKEVEFKDSGIEWIGQIPKHWEAKRIKMMSQVKRGASPRPIDDQKYFDDEGEYSWVRISDVSASNKYLYETTQKMSNLGKSLSVPLNPGELFISIAGTVGKPIITQIKCCIHDGFVYFVNLKYNKYLIYYIFESGIAYQGLGKMGTQLNLNTETIGNITLPVPPIQEQEQIVTYLDNKTTKIDSMIEKVNKEITLLKEYKEALINNVVTGKIKIIQ